jgi:cell division protein ZapE
VESSGSIERGYGDLDYSPPHGPGAEWNIVSDISSAKKLFLSGVPRLGAERGNEARRFTWLVDVFYDHKVKLVATAEVPAEGLYTAGPQAGEFARTVSRLAEMRSHEYLASAHRRYETHGPDTRPAG